MGAASGLLWPMCFLFKGPPLQEAGFEWSALLTLRPDVDSGLRRVGKVRGCPSPEVFTDFFGKHSRQVITWASSFLSQELKVVLMCCSVWTVTLQPVFLYCEAAVNICPRGKYMLGFSRPVFVPHTPAAAFRQLWPWCRGRGRLLVQLPWGLLSVAPLPVSSWLLDLIYPFWRGEDRWSLQSFLLPHFPVCPIPVNF